MGKSILFVVNDYYPSSRATSMIMQRLAEKLVEKGFSVDVLAVHTGMKETKNLVLPKEHNKVRIYDWIDISNELPINRKKVIKRWKQRNQLWLRFYQKFKILAIKCFYGNEEAFKSSSIGKFVREKTVEKPESKSALCEYTECVVKMIEKSGASTVISVLGPMSIHECVSLAKKKKDFTWVPFCLDPYAFDMTLSPEKKEIRLKEEYKVYINADRIFMLSEAKNDHVNDWISKKTTYFDLPNIRPIIADEEQRKVMFDKAKVNCVFLGDFYWFEKSPNYLLELFDGLCRIDCKLYLIGYHDCLSSDFLDMWKKKMGNRLIVMDRIGFEQAKNVLFDADILINLGHETPNQCPSKVIDYISTGKPILSISRIEGCTSLLYLSKYENKIVLNEKEHPTTEDFSQLNSFIDKTKGIRNIPFEIILHEYQSCTMDTLVDKVMQYI